MGTETVSDVSVSPDKSIQPVDESKPSFGLVEITRKQKATKKVDVSFQLNQFKRFILFGTETHYKSATRRSINRWFVTETNFRVYLEECKVKSLKNLADVLAVYEDKTDENQKKKDDIITRMIEFMLENSKNSPVGVIPYLLSRIYSYPLLRPVILKTFIAVIKDSTDLLIFASYMRKVGGNHNSIRRLISEWYNIHSTDRELLKDLLLVKRRLSWKHRDVLVHWKIPVNENNGILRILMGFKYEKSKVPEDKVSMIEKLLVLRQMDNRARWLRCVQSQDYIDEIGLDLCYNVKTLIFNVDVLKICIERLPFNDLIEHVPRMIQKINYNKELMKSLVTQFTDWKTKYSPIKQSDINMLSVFVVWKWLAFQYYIYHGPGKNARDENTIEKKYYPVSTLDLEQLVLSILEDPMFRRSEEVLFILNIPNTDLEESGINFPKKPSNQELKRPCLFPNIIKFTEFMQFLLFVYPNHRVIYRGKNYQIQGDSYKTIEEEFSKMKQNTLKCEPQGPPKNFKSAIYVTFDGSVDFNEEGPLKTHKVEKTVVLFIRDKDLVPVKDKLNQRNLLVIRGLDSNFFSFIEKYLHNNC